MVTWRSVSRRVSGKAELAFDQTLAPAPPLTAEPANDLHANAGIVEFGAERFSLKVTHSHLAFGGQTHR